MEPVIYNNEYLRRHRLYSVCPSTLNNISERDYPHKKYFSEKIECLDIDTYEKKNRRVNPDCTVDAVIAVSDYSAQKNTFNSRLLLVELRMGYKSANGLSKSQMEKKVLHTMDLIGHELHVENKKVFIFTNEVAPQARSLVNSLLHEGGEIKNFVVWSVKDFNSNVRDIKDMPYIPLYAPETISTELNSFVLSNQWNKLFTKIYFWLDIAERYRYANYFEFENIRNVILKEWDKIRSFKPEFDDEDVELKAQILEEDMKSILSC